MITKYICSDREELYQSVANKCASQLEQAISNHGDASIIVPGGTTPAPVFELLSSMSLDWKNITITPSDERWIDVSHSQSNENLIMKSLKINKAQVARLVGLKSAAETNIEGELETEQALQNLTFPTAVTVLGMGLDGHVASLFPNCPQIDDALDLAQIKMAMAINAEGCDVAGEYTQRISLTMATLLNSQLIIILITGNDKLDVIRKAGKENVKPVIPVSVLLAQKLTPVEIYWAK